MGGVKNGNKYRETEKVNTNYSTGQVFNKQDTKILENLCSLKWKRNKKNTHLDLILQIGGFFFIQNEFI